MTVKEYVYSRPGNLYGKKIRLLDNNRKFMGEWWLFPTLEVKKIKVTTKYIFIFV